MMASRIVKLVPGKTAFFVCDIQERFRSVIYAYDSVIATSEKMVRAAKILEIPVIVTEQNPRALGVTVPLTLESLPSTLYTGPIAKTKFSMVLPEVLSQLEAFGTKSVVIFGIESHVCVLQTALDLLELDFGVHILLDGISSCNHDEVPVAVARLRAAGCQITTSESALFQLMVDSSHPQFRTISGLVKETKEATKTAVATLNKM